MDQGGKLLNNPEAKNLFQKSDYEICPTGTTVSYQNGPAERDCRTVADMMKSYLTDGNLDSKF